MYSQLIFNSGTKTIQWGKEQSFQQMLGQLNTHIQESQVGPFLDTIHIKITKWVKQLNVQAEIIKLLEDNIDGNLCNLGLVNGFLYTGLTKRFVRFFRKMALVALSCL